VIQRDYFTVLAGVSEQTIFPLDDTELEMPPIQFPLQTFANSSEGRHFSTQAHRATLPHLLQQSGFPYAWRADNDNMLLSRVERSQSLEFFFATDKGKALVHKGKICSRGHRKGTGVNSLSRPH
jgi:hypothetical protein